MFSLVPKDRVAEAFELRVSGEFLNRLDDPPGDLLDITGGFAGDFDTDGGVTIDMVGGFTIVGRVGDVSDVSEGKTVFLVDDEVANFLNGGEATDGANVDLAAPLHDETVGDGKILGPHGVHELVRIDAVAADPLLEEFDLDFFAPDPPDLDVTHPLDAAERGFDQGLGNMVFILDGIRDVEDQIHDGDVTLIPPAHVDLFEVVGHVRHESVHPIAKVGVSGLKVGIVLEGDAHGCPARTDGTVYLTYSADGAHHIFDGAGNFIFDIAGARIAIGGVDAETLFFHALREEGDGNTGVGDETEHQNRAQNHDHSYGPSNRKAGKAVGNGIAARHDRRRA